MTDHLETYRQIVRSMRFSPPLSLTHLSQAAVHRVTTVPVDSLPHPTLSDTHWQLVSEPPTDPSEYTAALIHQAVRKPTVLPTTYTILENIGDRISRLTAQKPTIPVISPFKIPQADTKGTLAQEREPEITQATSRQSIENTPVIAVAQPVAVEDTAPAEAAVVSEPVVEEELLAPNLVVLESVAVEETPLETLDNISTDVIAEPTVVIPIASDSSSEVNTPDIEAKDNHTPTLLERVSSVVEAVSNVLKNPDPEPQNSDVVEEIAPPDSVTTEALTTAALAPEDEAEETSVPTLLEKVSSAVESVVTSLKNVGVDQKNSEAVVDPAPAKDDTLTSEISEITCPKCHSTDIRKNGHRQDKQRYICKDCRRQFVISSSVKEEHNSELEESASFETSTIEESKTNTGLSNRIAKESKHSSKKKPKARGFGNSKAK